jgi:alpha-L-rhamnosidase
MKKWVAFMRGFLKDDLMPRDTYGDWCVPPESLNLIHSKDPQRRTAGPVLGTAYFYRILRLMSRYAELLAQPDDAREYDALAARLRAAFHARFFDSGRKQYDNGSQTSSILPLAFGMAPEAERAAIFQELVRKIEVESQSHVGTGLIGGQWLMRVLSDHGRADLAYTLASQQTYPSWGYMLARGATTIWELWNGDTADPAMNSHNHLMLIGDLNIWLHEYLAGIRPDPAQPGFKRIVIQPHPVGDLTFVEATHRSLYGEIASRWRREAGRFTLELRLPANTTALVHVPAPSPEAVTESGRPAAAAPSVRFLHMRRGAAVFAVPAGSYRFEAALTPDK